MTLLMEFMKEKTGRYPVCFANVLMSCMSDVALNISLQSMTRDFLGIFEYSGGISNDK
jgi:hypothetical protein